jgi:hypothetical protein
MAHLGPVGLGDEAGAGAEDVDGLEERAGARASVEDTLAAGPRYLLTRSMLIN